MLNIFNNIEETTSNSSVFTETEQAVYTNNTAVPEYIAKRLIEINESSYGGVHEINTLSATSFSDSIKQQIFHLERAENFYKITVDVSDLIKSVQGSVLHEAYLIKEPSRKFKDVLGYKISGGADKIENGHLRDIKTSSTYILKKLKAELEMYDYSTSLADLKVKLPTMFKYTIQQSIYNWLYDLNTSFATLDFILMNWGPMNRSEVGEMIQAVEIPLYSATETEDYVTNVVSKIIGYRESGFKPDCTDIELGGKSIPEYKLVKPGKTRRVAKSGLYRSLTEAANAQANFPGTVILDSTKPATPSICLNFCKYNKAGVCEQGKKIREEQNRD